LTIWQNNNVKLATWECKPDNVDLKLVNRKIQLGQYKLSNLAKWSWQREKMNLAKILKHLVFPNGPMH
jgi:hypothetical protein